MPTQRLMTITVTLAQVTLVKNGSGPTPNSSFNSRLNYTVLLDHGIDYQQGYKLRHSDGQYEDKTPEGFELRPSRLMMIARIIPKI